jgi:hypothetical protein
VRRIDRGHGTMLRDFRYGYRVRRDAWSRMMRPAGKEFVMGQSVDDRVDRGHRTSTCGHLDELKRRLAFPNDSKNPSCQNSWPSWKRTGSGTWSS